MTVTGEPGQHLLVVEPEEYLEALAAALTAPGADRAARLRDDLLIPLAAADLAATETGAAWRVVGAVRELWSRVELPADLEPAWAALAEASRSGSPEEIGELAARLAKINAEVWLTAVEPVAGGGVVLGYHATLRQDLLPAADPSQQRAGIVVRHREHGTEQRLSGDDLAQHSADGTGLVWSGRAVLDAETAADGAPLGPGIWDAYVRVEALGLTRDVRLGARRLEPRGGLADPPITVRPDGRIDQLYYTAYGNLSLTVRATARWLRAALAGGELDVTATGVRYRTKVRWSGPQPVLRLDLERAGSGRRSRWRLVAAGPHWVGSPQREQLWLARGNYRATVGVTPTDAATGVEGIEVTGALVVDKTARQHWRRAVIRSGIAALLRRAHRVRRRR